MKKQFLVLILLLSCMALPWMVKAQSGKGDVTLSLGISTGNGYPNALRYERNSGAGTVPLSLEYRVNRLFSAGAYISGTYTWYNYDASPPNYTNVWKGWDIGLKGTFHWSPLVMKYDKLDLYVSGFAGRTNMSMELDKNNFYGDSLNYSVRTLNAGAIVGGRYYFNRHLGVYVEGGLARVAFIGAGLTWNIRGKSREGK